MSRAAIPKPNLFLVGAPKCGTTAFSEYLRSHPDVFFSHPKEPHFFSSDIPTYRSFRTLSHYLSLFRDVKEERYIAEGSTSYLRSNSAIRKIREFNPEARFIAFVRNPVDQCCAYHRQMINNCDEDVSDFKRAWRLQESRAKGVHLPARCRHPALLQYRAAANLGSQIRRLMDTVPPERRHILVFDDLQQDPTGVYREVLAFLNLRNDGRVEFPIVNRSYQYRLPGVARAVLRPPAYLRRVANLAQRVNGQRPLGIYRGLYYFVDSYMRRDAGTSHVTPAMHRELVHVFLEEIELLSELLNRDLSHWLQPSQ